MYDGLCHCKMEQLQSLRSSLCKNSELKRQVRPSSILNAILRWNDTKKKNDILKWN